MALIDARNIFSDKQVVTATTLSQAAIDMTGSADYGVGTNLYVHCLTQGDFAKDLRVQVLGSADTTFSSPIILGDSGVIPKANLVNGSDFFVRINEMGKKYRYVCLRYIPSTDGVESTTITGNDTPDITHLAPVTAVGSEDTAVANAIRAQIETVAALGTQYTYANYEKTTG